MKKLTLNLITLFLTVSFFAQNNTEKENNFFELKCSVKGNLQNNKKIKLRVSEKGRLYAEVTLKKKMLEFDLPKGSQYMLEFSADGHFTKRIAISTEIIDEVEFIPIFDVTVNLVEEDSPLLLAKDLDLLDFPVAYMAFDSEKRTFYDKNKYYSDIIAKGIKKSSKQYLKESASIN